MSFSTPGPAVSCAAAQKNSDRSAAPFYVTPAWKQFVRRTCPFPRSPTMRDCGRDKTLTGGACPSRIYFVPPERRAESSRPTTGKEPAAGASPRPTGDRISKSGRPHRAAPTERLRTIWDGRVWAPYGISSTRGICSATPGAVVEPHQRQFLHPQAPVGREETWAVTQILRAGNFASTKQVRVPRNGVRGKANMDTKCPS